MIAIGLCFGTVISVGLSRFAYGLVLPAMKQDLGWTYTEAGWINPAYAIGYLAGALLALRVLGTLGPRRMFFAGMVLVSMSLLARDHG
jgi:predicted MFS family arabinose efflux permease